MIGGAPRSRVLLMLVVGLLAVGAAPAAAGPFATGAEILSASEARLEQGDDATTEVVLTRDARHVVFATRATNFFADDDPDPPGRARLGGLFRRVVATGALELVADGDLVDEETRDLIIRGARSPSVSDDGRFVAFSTNAPLVAADTNSNADVYIRDMTVPIRAPGAFVLASAKDGGDVPFVYAVRDPDRPGRNPGAEVSTATSLSADGRRVAFRIEELASDAPDRPVVDTPGNQVVVRDVVARTTSIVSRVAASGAPAGGATGPVVLSADGSTVAWVGANAPAQTRFLPGEQPDAFAPFYLWRRIADGPDAPTRRITGLADPDDPACGGGSVSSDPVATGPCFGPLGDTEQGRGEIGQRIPSLSADGTVVAFLAAAAARPSGVNNPGLDLYVTSMAPGLSRKAATIELTREGNADDSSQSAAIESATVTPDGGGVFIVTSRTRFVLPALVPIGVFRTAPTARELHYVDLRRRTIERVVTGLGGADPTGDVAINPSASQDGTAVAFVSGAGNLFVGDANERGDAFLVRRTPDLVPELPPPVFDEAVQPPAIQDADTPTGPDLLPRVTSLRDGRLRVRVRAPAAGTFTVFARSGRPLRTVARQTRRATRRVTVTIHLRLGPRDRTRLRRTRRLSTTVRIRFVPATSGQRALADSARGTFRLPARRRPAPRRRRAVLATAPAGLPVSPW